MNIVRCGVFAIGCVFAGSVNAGAACTGLEAHTCALPFPSNEFSLVNAATATGVELSISDDVLPPGKLALLPGSVRPAAILNGRDGFSPMGAAMFELTSEALADQLAADPQQWVHAYSVDTGEPIDVVAARSPIERSSQFSWGPIIEVYPASRYPFGERIVIVISMPDNAAVPDDYAAPARELSEAAWQLLEHNDIAAQSVVTATEYTIASAESVLGEHERGQAAITDFDYPIEIVRTLYYRTGHVAAKVKGKVLLPDFRGEDGLVNVNNDAQANAQWIPFDLYLPRSAGKASAPVMIYGHGITANRYTSIFVHRQNARHGIATLAIDQPNHGSRISIDGYSVFQVLRTDRLPRALGMVMQSAFDLHGLTSMIEKQLHTVDALPKKIWGRSGDGIPDIDTSRILYSGTSLGGVLGSGFAAFDDRVDGVYLQVSGTGIARIMTHSSFWGLGFKNLISREFTAGETAFQAMLTQHVVDMVEGGMRAESYNRETKPLFIQYGLDDTVATNASTFSLAGIAGLQLNPPVLADVPGMLVNGVYDPLMGVLQVEPVVRKGWLHGFTAHTTFIKSQAIDAYRQWLDAINARW